MRVLADGSVAASDGASAPRSDASAAGAAPEDTIFALASGAGRAAIAVMRISGPATPRLLETLCAGRLPPPRQAALRRLTGADGAVLDHALTLWLPGPGSYTGEDSAELHLHGGRAVIEGVAGELARLGARPADPGEFTRRAFLNGRMDLVEAEAVHDLVAAETEAQRRQALRQLEGELGTLYRGWADTLRTLLAQQEALIDFPDEDLPPEVEAAMLGAMHNLATEIAAHLDDDRRGERLREGLCFAIAGPPNVGKSSLLNALAARDVAIVSAQPGTTRDALETRVVLGGVPVTLVDTAGLRETTDAIEAEGVRRARLRAAEADLVIAVTAFGVDTVPETATEPDGPAVRHLRVVNKADLLDARAAATPITALPPGPLSAATPPHGELPELGSLADAEPEEALLVSVMTGAGLDALRDRLAAEARSLTESEGPPPLTRARHRAALRAAHTHLVAAEAAAWPELRGEDLRLALRALGRITGQVGVEDILDTLFAQFCIGK